MNAVAIRTDVSDMRRHAVRGPWGAERVGPIADDSDVDEAQKRYLAAAQAMRAALAAIAEEVRPRPLYHVFSNLRSTELPPVGGRLSVGHITIHPRDLNVGRYVLSTNYDFSLSHALGQTRDVIPPAPSVVVDEWERAIQELYDAASDWDDPDGAPPADVTIRAIERLLPAIRICARLPVFDLNDDGSVALRWKKRGEPRSFALHFGRRLISAVLSEPKNGPGFANSIELNDHPHIIETGIVGLLLKTEVTALVK